MADFVPKDMTGTLFKNDRKNTDKHPDYTGTLVVNGQEFWLSAWLKDGKRGKYMSLGLRAKDDAGQARQPAKETRNSYAEAKGKPATAAPTYAEELDDEIPF